MLAVTLTGTLAATLNADCNAHCTVFCNSDCEVPLQTANLFATLLRENVREWKIMPKTGLEICGDLEVRRVQRVRGLQSVGTVRRGFSGQTPQFPPTPTK